MAEQRNKNLIQVDETNEVVVVPICRKMVPFRIAFVKNVSFVDNIKQKCHIRITFNVPGPSFFLENTGEVSLREISYLSKDSRHGIQVVEKIKKLRSKVVARESKEAHRATLVSQEKLVLAGYKSKPIKLSNISIRPSFGGRGRKLPGTLEAHRNGFRYSTSRPDERVDILFCNVKHAFFQPAEKEMITLLHFHLHNHIMVGNKKTKDVQVYVEVMDVVQTLGGGGNRATYDADELHEEERERNRKRKIKNDFQNFVSRASDHIKFDMPLRKLGFHGVPYKASVFLVPTSNCLVELIETPFLVVAFSEIEIVNLERVGLGQKNFDMTIVFKDLKRDVVRIDSIPSTSLDGIKKWLVKIDIKYYENRLNLNWKAILKTINDDPQRFIDDGRWQFLNMEVSDSDSEGSEEFDQRYEPSESDSDDDDSGSGSESDSEDGGSETEDEDEDGASEEDEGAHKRRKFQ